MRVLFVSQEVPPDTNWGGIGTYIDVMTQALAEDGHEVHVLSVVPGQPVSRTRRGQVTVHRRATPAARDPTGHLPETWRRLMLGASVARVMGTLGLRPDVVECPEWMAEGIFVALRGRLPLVVRLHAGARQVFPVSGLGRGSRGLDGKLAAWLEESSTRLANVVVSTRSHLDEVAGPLGLDEGSLHAIPVPIRVPDPSPLNGSNPPLVVCVGRLEPRKSPEVLVRAAPRVLQAVPEARFVFVGRDNMPPGAASSSSYLRQEAHRLGVAHAIEFTGQIDQAAVYRELERSTVCAFPSRWECFANAAAEALAVGRPVVATPISAFRERVKEGVTGRLVAAEDTQGWADALIELLRDRALARRMGDAGAAHMGATSDPHRVADLTLEAYEHAVKRWHAGLRAAQRRRIPRPARRR
jgi:glycosyltransferase involved in cell wall biosynthesis